MNKDIIKEVLNTAVYAPSGENSQPWRFEVKDNVIYQYNLPDKDNPIYNYRQRGSYFAHGALLQNIILLFKARGYDVDFSLLPNGGKDNLVAKIILKEAEKVESSLVNFIKKRITNRKKYKNTPLTDEQKEKLKAIAGEFHEVSLLIVEKEEDKRKLSGVFSNNDRIMLENKSLHDSVFHNICWNEAEEKSKKCGLYVKTMELAPPQFMIFKLLKNWKVAEVFKKMGMTKFIAKENAKIYATGAAYLSFLVDNEDISFIKAGMLVQKIWLQIIKWGLSAHPLAALPYLYARVSTNSLDGFFVEHIDLIKDSYKILKDLYKISDSKSIAMTLRVGKSDAPSGTSSRLEPEVVFCE